MGEGAGAAPHGGPDRLAAYAPPEPRVAAGRVLQEAHDLLARALEALVMRRDFAHAGELVGQASDRIGSALHFMRQALRR